MLNTLFNWLGGPTEAEDEGPRYSDVYDMMRYRIADGDARDDLPMVIAFRVKSGPQIQDPDPRPSFALLESADEWGRWHKAFFGEVVWTDDLRVTDKPLLYWNEMQSQFSVPYEITTTYLPEIEEDGWPPLALYAKASDSPHDFGAARARYRFEQGVAVYSL